MAKVNDMAALEKFLKKHKGKPVAIESDDPAVQKYLETGKKVSAKSFAKKTGG
jgi:hypothetical protein